MQTHQLAQVTIDERPEKAEVEVKAEIPTERVALFRGKATVEISKDVSIDGFRKGNVPEAVLIKHVGESAIMERAASLGISHELPLLLAEKQVLAIETPKVTITKLAPGNPIAFTALITVQPEVTLPDYVKIAKKHVAKKEMPTVADDEVADMTRYLRRERARIDMVEKGEDAEKAYEKSQGLTEDALPPIDDEFAKSLGAKDAVDLADRMKENMLTDKVRKAGEKVRLAIVEDIIAGSSMPLPGILVERELDRMMHRFEDDIIRGGSTLDAYLADAKKTRDDFRKEWREAAEKRAKMHLAMGKIAVTEKIDAPKDLVEHEIEHIMRHQPTADIEEMRPYIESAFMPEAVFRWLETQK
ncbi:MAG: trigger factor [Patescibacteria group bacterium]